MIRSIGFAPGEFYHLYSRGNNKRKIFYDDRDRVRFLFLLLYHQSPESFLNLGRQVSYHVRHQVFNINKEIQQDILKSKFVKLISFVLMPNHFHLIVMERKPKGISRYMQKTLDAYAKYFNAKYENSGHLFQGPFGAVHVEDDNQLLYLSAYIHRNPRELSGWRNRELKYPWSSYQDFAIGNRWGKLLEPKIILDQFDDGSDYKNFVESSSAKDNLDEEILFDD